MKITKSKKRKTTVKQGGAERGLSKPLCSADHTLVPYVGASMKFQITTHGNKHYYRCALCGFEDWN